MPAICERRVLPVAGCAPGRSVTRTRVGLLLAAPAPSRSLRPGRRLDVKLWPVLRYARNDDARRAALERARPLIEYVRTPELRDLRIRPLLWLTRRLGDAPDDRMEILFPILSARASANYRSLRFLPRSPPWTAPHADASASDLVVHALPVRLLASDRERGTTGGVLPFYLDLADVFGYERVRTVLFPAYLELDEPRVERRFYGFPFVSTVGGPDGRGLRVWPFYGNTAVAGRERERFVALAVPHRQRRLVPELRLGAAAPRLPGYAALDGELRTSRGYGVLAYTRTVDERLGSEATGAPWPVVFRERRLGDETWRVLARWPRSTAAATATAFARASTSGRSTGRPSRTTATSTSGGAMACWCSGATSASGTRTPGARAASTPLLGVLRSDARDGRPPGRFRR